LSVKKETLDRFARKLAENAERLYVAESEVKRLKNVRQRLVSRYLSVKKNDEDSMEMINGGVDNGEDKQDDDIKED